jgi:hypothetical protein
MSARQRKTTKPMYKYLGVQIMNESVTALEHFRLSIARAEALRMRSSAVLVADLKILLKIAESAVQRHTRRCQQLSQKPKPKFQSVIDV